MNKKIVYDNLMNYEKKLITYRKAIKEFNEMYEPKKNEAEEYILDILEMNELDSGNFFEVHNENIFREIPIKELKSQLNDGNILDNICVTIDFEATREHLKINLGLEDALIDITLNHLKSRNIISKKTLKEKL